MNTFLEYKCTSLLNLLQIVSSKEWREQNRHQKVEGGGANHLKCCMGAHVVREKQKNDRLHRLNTELIYLFSLFLV